MSLSMLPRGTQGSKRRRPWAVIGLGKGSRISAGTTLCPSVVPLSARTRLEHVLHNDNWTYFPETPWLRGRIMTPDVV